VDGSVTLDWDDLRFFLAVARHRSLSGAARSLKVTQPTAGRRLAALEQALGSTLFHRASTGLALSRSGRTLLAYAERIERDVIAAERATAGHDGELEGVVRVTAPEWLCARALGARLGELVARHPGIEIALDADARWRSLPRRDADVALRLARFEGQDVIQRAVGRVAFGLYASPAYVEARGLPDFQRSSAGHSLVTMSDDVPATADAAWLDAVASGARVVWRSHGRHVHASVAAAGAGLVCLPRCLGDETPGLTLLDTSQPPERTLWLGIHRDARRVRRVRAVVDLMKERPLL